RLEKEDRNDPGTLARLRGWGFNTVVVPAADASAWDGGVVAVAAANFCDAASVIRAPGVRLPDVFEPGWSDRAHEHAASCCAPLREHPAVLGWLFDEELSWGVHAGAGRPTLLQVCLSLEPNFAAYHAAWEFVLAPHGGKLASLAKAWSQPMANREGVRELTRNEQALASRGYLRDNLRWTREFAGRYFKLTSDAIRAHDPNHLLLGAPGAAESGEIEATGAATRVTAFAPVDVMWASWNDVPASAPGPVFAADFTWAAETFFQPSGRSRGLTSVERMLRKGRVALQRLVGHPAVVGYSWPRWRDHPGEQPPFASGLVHVNGAEAREHTELVADIHLKVSKLRPWASGPSSQ
ncbi:MAG TPA: hypothetical protein VEQ65_02820, partial [Opitutus sp.]|nr:hypothetical protein [Opitutus sp.]